MKNKHKKIFNYSLIAVILISSNSFGLFAQNNQEQVKKTAKTTNANSKIASEIRKITGTVTDQSGLPIIGASIRLSVGQKGTISDLNGKFSLDAPSDETLIVSYIGFNSLKVPITGQSKLAIELTEKMKQLDEVVVVGYGTIKKSDLTGSVSKLAAKNTEEKSVSSIEQMLQGQLAGVQIVENTGGLGGGMTFSIRGANSASGSNQPLVVIDGYPVESGTMNISTGSDNSAPSMGINALSSLNPNDIESIEILKDASSTAIYGSRGANGVVMVTTKKGKEGADKVEYSFRTDISTVPTKLKVLGTTDFLGFYNEANMDRGDGTLVYSNAKMKELEAINTNWQDLLFRTAVSQNHQLSFSGGDKKMKYAFSLGYLGQDGVVQNTHFDRGTFRLNLDRTVNIRFKFGVNISGNMSKNKAVGQSNANIASNSVVLAALKSLPIQNAIDANNEIALTNSQTNPLVLFTTADDQQRATLINATAFGEYKITKDLTAKVSLGANNYSGLRQSYMPRGTYAGDQSGGVAYAGHSSSFNYLTETTLNYAKTFGSRHSINAVGGYTWQSWIDRSDGVTVTGFPNDKYLYYNLSSGSNTSKPANITNERSLASFLGRVNYVFDKKYLLTVSVRDDGSTVLAPGKKWSLFPSAALGWNIHNEEFMLYQDIISELKLRGSYGVSGNQSVSVGSTVSKYGASNATINETLTTVYIPTDMANNTLGWEITKQVNAGIDFSLFNNRVGGSVDVYQKTTSNLLINLPIPASSGYTNYTTNAGDVENKGIEVSLRGNILTGKFQWSINGNISFNRNKILGFDGNMQSFQGPGNGQVNGQPLTIAKVGYPIGSFYGYKIIGIYQTQDEIDKYAVDPSSPKPGSFKFADISGPNGKPDGLISDYDRTIIGNPYPDYIFGVNNDFSWKSFSLNVFIQGSIGQDVVNANRFFLDGLVAGSNVSLEAYNNRWTGPGTSTTYPGARTGITPFAGRFSDFLVEDASFVRLKSMTLSYTFNPKKIKPLTSMKVFVSGKNLLTLTKYKGYDPEVNAMGQNSMTQGIDIGTIPQYLTLSAGLSVSF